jgi:DNA-binding NarL/FixJ family response regulator
VGSRDAIGLLHRTACGYSGTSLDIVTTTFGPRSMIEDDEGLTVVAEAADGNTALALVKKLLPDVAVIDIDMSGLDGFGVMHEIRKLKLRTSVVFLTLHVEKDMYRAVMEMDGRGYLLKDNAMEEIPVGIRAVALGQLYLSSAVTTRPLQKPEKAPAPSQNPLARDLIPTECPILRLIGDGNRARRLGRSSHPLPVDNHRTNVCRKLHVEGGNARLRFALQNKASL